MAEGKIEFRRKLVMERGILSFDGCPLVVQYIGWNVYVGSVVSTRLLMTLYIIHTLSTFLIV